MAQNSPASTQKEISNIVSTLKEQGKGHLASAIEGNWDKTLLEYSKSLRSYKPDMPIEDNLKQALSLELVRLGYKASEIFEFIEYLETNRTIQTGPHISPAGKPRYFFINWLASLSLTDKDYYPVAMFSGVPFSNKTRPGRLSKSNGDINLIPSIMQDELVYRNIITEKMSEVVTDLPVELKNLLPEVKIGESYTAWALKSSQKIEGEFLRGKPIFFDFNEVISNYLKLVLKDKEHPISRMLFSPNERGQVISSFEDTVFFYAPIKKDKYDTLEGFFLRDGFLEGTSRNINLDPETLSRELDGRLCPGLVLGFLVLSFLNRFKCFGSFAQVEYLPLYKEKFSNLDFLKKYNIDQAPEGALTTGGFPHDPDLHALDIALGKEFSPDENKLFGEALIAIKDVLLKQNYSLNLVKK